MEVLFKRCSCSETPVFVAWTLRRPHVRTQRVNLLLARATVCTVGKLTVTFQLSCPWLRPLVVSHLVWLTQHMCCWAGQSSLAPPPHPHLPVPSAAPLQTSPDGGRRSLHLFSPDQVGESVGRSLRAEPRSKSAANLLSAASVRTLFAI